MVEVTCRTIHSRFLLRPSPELNDIVVGVLARAQRAAYREASEKLRAGNLTVPFPIGSFPPPHPEVCH